MVSTFYRSGHTSPQPPATGVVPAPDTPPVPPEVGLLTACGAHDSHAVVLADGVTPNRSPRAGTPYTTITWSGIRAMVLSPAAVAKDRARFVIPSSYAGCDGRTHEVQRLRGVFHGLAIDIDKGDPSLDEVAAAVDAVTGGAGVLIYSSSSAKPNNRKWRVLIPLVTPVAGEDYADTQVSLFRLLGQHGLTCDATLARSAQPVYLPNVPPEKRDDSGQPLFYQHRLVDGHRLDLHADHDIVRQRDRLRAAREAEKVERDARAAEYKTRRLAHVEATGDDFQPIQHFKDHHTVGEMLARYGFTQSPRSPSDWKSPLSTSGSFSTKDYGDHWVTVSNWAHAHNVGRPSAGGFRSGDAFDLFAFFEHGNDRQAAARAYTHEVRPRAAQPAAMPVAGRPVPAGSARSLDGWRAEVAQRRAVAVTQPGLHVDRSPTGSGKTHATIVALAGVNSSLTVLPTHANVRERVEEMRQHGIDAVAYPELTDTTCLNYAEASHAQRLGLVAGAAVCPTCPFKDQCTYREDAKAADKADHRVGTHERLRRSSRAAKGVSVVVVDEMPEEVLAPTLTVTLDEIGPVQTLAHAVQNFFWTEADPAQRAFAGAMLEVVDAIHRAVGQVTGEGVVPVALRGGDDVPDKWQRLLFKSIRKVGVAKSLNPDALSLVTRAAVGDLISLEVVTDTPPSGPVHFIVGSWRPALPAAASVVALDATADAGDLSLAVGTPVDDCTPDGHLTPQHDVVQLTDDITRGTTPETVAAVVEAFLKRHPEVQRLGIIGHRLHIRSLIDDEMLAPWARARVAKWCYFGQGPDRASNDWHRACDHGLVLGTPRPNPGTHRRWLVQHGLRDAAGRTPVWGSRPWESFTTAGVPCTVDGTGYWDDDWHRAYVATARAALFQSIGRWRSILPEGCPVTVVTSDPTPYPIAPPLEPAGNARREVVEVVRTLLAPGVGCELLPIGNTYSGKFVSGAVSTGAVVAAVAAKTQTTEKPGGVTRRAVEKRLRAAAEAGDLVRPDGRRGWWALPPAAGVTTAVVSTPPPTDQPAVVSSAPYPRDRNTPETITSDPGIVAVSAPRPRPGVVVSALPAVVRPLAVEVVIADRAGVATVSTDTSMQPAAAIDDDVLMLVEERAAIIEFDAGHQRDDADRLARAMVLGQETQSVVVADAPVPVGVLPAEVADIEARDLPMVRAALRTFGGVVRRLPDRDPRAGDPRRRSKPPPGTCACGHDDKWVPIPIHGGRSSRVECGHCDRFGWWGVWYGVRQPSPFDEAQPAKPPPLPPPMDAVPAVTQVPA